MGFVWRSPPQRRETGPGQRDGTAPWCHWGTAPGRGDSEQRPRGRDRAGGRRRVSAGGGQRGRGGPRGGGATPAGQGSPDSERGSMVRGGLPVGVRVSVCVNGVGACAERLVHPVFRVLDSSRRQWSPLSTCHGQPPRSHPPLVSGFVFRSGLSGSASGTFASSQQSELCRAGMSPRHRRWPSGGQLTTWRAVRQVPVAAPGGWPWRGVTSTPAIWSSRGSPVPHTHAGPPPSSSPTSARARALPAVAPLHSAPADDSCGPGR